MGTNQKTLKDYSGFGAHATSISHFNSEFLLYEPYSVVSATLKLYYILPMLLISDISSGYNQLHEQQPSHQ